MTITYHCSICGIEVETLEDEIAYCPEHPDAIIDSVVTTTQAAPAMDAINEKELLIDLLLLDKGVAMFYLPATATEPGEYVGYSCEVDEQTGEISVITDREVCARFPFDTPLSEIETWLVEQEQLLMVF